jgi:pectate lyase
VTADAAHTYTVTNRNELLAALYTNLVINPDGSFTGTLDNTPKIIFVEGTINLNMNKALVEQTEADYVCPIDSNTIKVAYNFDDYKNFYDPNGSWGTKAVAGDLETARVCASNKQKAVIQFKVGSNTSIIGKGNNAKIVRGHMRLSPPSDNIIIRNVHFEDAFDMFPQWDPTDSGGRWNSLYDNISIDGATHVWIDHCSFSDGANRDKLYPPVFAAPYNLPEMKVQHHDGAIDVSKNANYVTLSYNYVHDHDKTHLIGSSDTVASDNGPGFLKITMHHNYFKDVTQRLPRVRMGTVHVYNNYYDGQLKPTSIDRNYAFSVGLATGQFGKIYAENNVFEIAASTEGVQATVDNLYSVSFKDTASVITACTNAGYTAADCSTLFYASGTVLNGAPVDLMAAAVANAAAQTTPLVLNSAATYWKPADIYQYKLDSAIGLRETILAKAGAGNCTDCANTTKPVPVPASSASSSASSLSSSSSSSASSEEPIAMNCGANVYFCDDFSASSASNWNLLPVAGPNGKFDLFTQNANQMLRYTAATSGAAGGVLALVKPAALAGVTSADYYVEARIRPRLNSSGTAQRSIYVMARYQDANNWYGVGMTAHENPTSQRVEIVERAGTGTPASVGTMRYSTPLVLGTAGGIDGEWYKLRLELIGTEMKLYLNDLQVGSFSDGSLTQRGLIGIYTSNRSFEIDDIKVGNANDRPPVPSQLSISPVANYSAEVGDTARLITVTAKNQQSADDTFTVQSSNPAVVAVSTNGSQVSLNPVGEGSATITFTSGSDASLTRTLTATIAPQFVMPSASYNLTGLVSPAVNETNVYADTSLSLTFDSPPTLGTVGAIRIFKSSDDTVVDTIKLVDHKESIGFGTLRTLNTRPISISGNTVTIALQSKKLEYNTSYYVAISGSAFTGATLATLPFEGIGKNAGWTFTTKPAPAAGLTALTVDDNGNTADFRTLQGALNYVMQNLAKTDAATIAVKNGTYPELLYLRNKDNLTITGESRDGVLIQYQNSEAFNSGTAGRPVFLVELADMLTLENLTLKNTTIRSEKASQAEALYFNSTGRLVLKHANFISEQDTLQLKGWNWIYRSLVAGNVDFIWGSSNAALFEESEIRSLGDSNGATNGGYIVQARVPAATDKGYVFLNSNLTQGIGPTGNSIPTGATYLARTGGTATWDNVVFINSRMGTHINPAGWLGTGTPATPTATTGWREFATMDANGNTISLTGRLGGRELTLGEVMNDYCNRAQIFAGYNSSAGWNPLPGDTTDCANFGQTSSSSSAVASSTVSSSAVSESSSSAISTSSTAASDQSSSESSAGSVAASQSSIASSQSSSLAGSETNSSDSSTSSSAALGNTPVLTMNFASLGTTGLAENTETTLTGEVDAPTVTNTENYLVKLTGKLKISTAQDPPSGASGSTGVVQFANNSSAVGKVIIKQVQCPFALQVKHAPSTAGDATRKLRITVNGAEVYLQGDGNFQVADLTPSCSGKVDVEAYGWDGTALGKGVRIFDLTITR